MSGGFDAVRHEPERAPVTVAEEAQRYLAVVEVFRAEGCEPHWRPEQTPSPPATQPVAERRK